MATNTESNSIIATHTITHARVTYTVNVPTWYRVLGWREVVRAALATKRFHRTGQYRTCRGNTVYTVVREHGGSVSVGCKPVSRVVRGASVRIGRYAQATCRAACQSRSTALHCDCDGAETMRGAPRTKRIAGGAVITPNYNSADGFIVAGLID